jgi:hypothetical protein
MVMAAVKDAIERGERAAVDRIVADLRAQANEMRGMGYCGRDGKPQFLDSLADRYERGEHRE